jgi:hypothetical protein
MAARVHNVFSLTEILKIFLSETTKSIELWLCRMIIHFWQVWLKSVQQFQRRRLKYEKLTDGRTTDTYLWQKLTWPMARWGKKDVKFIILVSNLKENI